MTLGFLFLGAMGVMNMFADISVVQALNPVRGILFLFDGKLNAATISWFLGSVFLCATGAEALYSDINFTLLKANIY